MRLEDLKHAPYQAYYCEENAWQIVARAQIQGVPSEVWVIGNSSARIALWGQRLAPSPRVPVVWDYHVVACLRPPGAPAMVLDPDSSVAGPLIAGHWFAATCPPGAAGLIGLAGLQLPRVRIIAGDSYLTEFSSDRRHMANGSGGFIRPPPPWPCLGPPTKPPHRLPELLDFSSAVGDARQPTPTSPGVFADPARHWPGMILDWDAAVLRTRAAHPMSA